MKSRAGFTLLELIITMAIMTVVLGLSTLSFKTWSSKSGIESQVRQLFTDLSDARIKAFHEKRGYRMIFQPNSYLLKNYSSQNEPSGAGTVVMNKNVKFGMTKTVSGDLTDTFVEFDTRGSSINNFTIVVNPLAVAAAVNCLVISETRVNMGKINGSVCEFK
jgi:prepilin-type N-terminal cleavage/methylation domain-containing protein